MQNIARSIDITYANSANYLTASGGCSVHYSALGNDCILANPVLSSTSGYGTFNASSMELLYPNGTAHPTSVYATAKIGSGTSGNTIALEFDGTEVAVNTAPIGEATRVYESSAQAVTASTRSSSIRFHTQKSSSIAYCDIRETASISLYFNRYDFSAVAGNNVTSAAVSSSTGYDGDSVTYSCVLASGAEFDGWYSAGTKVSASQTYTHTVNGADLALEARAIIPIVTKALSATYNGAQLQGFPISVQADAPITYGGVSKGTVPFSGGAKTLTCANKLCSGSIGIGGKTLQCAGKIMASNVVCQIT